MKRNCFKELLRIKYLLIVFISLTVSNTACSNFGGEIPTDLELENRFFKHKEDFEKLVVMSNADKTVTRIAYDFTWVSGEKNSGELRKDRPIGFSQERWDEYKKIFKTLKLEAGLSRSEETNKIWLLAYTQGLTTGGLTKGYMYSETENNCLDDSSDELTLNTDQRFLCKNIDDKWSIYLSE